MAEFGPVIDLSKFGPQSEPDPDTTYPCPVCGAPMPTVFEQNASGMMVVLSIIMHQNSHVMHAMAANMKEVVTEPATPICAGANHFFPSGRVSCLCFNAKRPLSAEMPEYYYHG